MPKKLQSSTPSLTHLLDDQAELLNHIVEAIENQDPEQQAIAQEILDSIIIPAIATKTDAIAYVIQHALPARVAELKGLESQVSTKRKSLENTIDAIKSRLKYLNSIGKIGDVITGDISEITISEGVPSVDDSQSDPATWGGEWCAFYETRIEYKINKKAILAAYKAGMPLPPGITIKQGQRLSVKIKD